MRVLAFLACCAVLGVAAIASTAAAQNRLPTPDPNFAAELVPSPCQLDTDDSVEKETYELEGWGAETNYTRYPGACRRMRFAYGPILVKPGQNDVLVGPVTIERPLEPGYVTRFKPNLVTETGAVPPVEEVHLHHGTWLSVPTYGSGPFFAAGEEKTIAPFPKGYGMPVKPTDTWLLLYMVHSAIQRPMTVWITYEIDFVPEDKADEAGGLTPALPIWLDVRPSAYPVFNIQRAYGGADGRCTWPKEQCADHDPYGNAIVGQGQPGNGIGRDLRLPARGQPFGVHPSFTGGTLIGLGGHLHPGGLQNEVDVVRDGRAQRIYNGVPTYWDREDKSRPGGPPTSWDFSMRVSGLPRWGVHVEPGDVLRSNATYDTTYGASYEDMGIVVGLLVPDDPAGNPRAPGVDPFAVEVDDSERCDSGGLEADPPRLCVNGFQETHGHYEENGNYSGPSGQTQLNAPPGPETNEIAIANFLYTPGDFSTANTLGIPRVRLGSTLRFWNLDGGLIPHTITTCKYPCLGQTGTAFPLADGETSAGRPLDLDSSELGYGLPYVGAAKQRIDWSVPVTEEEGFEPGEVVTYFCRIHPNMRGAFEVTE